DILSWGVILSEPEGMRRRVEGPRECKSHDAVRSFSTMQPDGYWVYIMASLSGTLYIGSTSDLSLRVWQHKNGVFEGFSKEYGCTRLVYYERYDGPHLSTRRERQLKGWRRSKKIALIERVNPHWQDLAASWG